MNGLIAAGMLGYLLLSRETWRLRVAVFGITLVTLVAMVIVGSVY